MAARWSSEHVVGEHRDLQASAMSVDCLGRYALLAGRRYLAIIDLNKPNETVKKLGRMSKWEVSVARWNAYSSQPNLFIIASNDRAELMNWTAGDIVHQNSLKGHTRVISDMDWSILDPALIASCSLDTYIYIWDVRDTRKPQTTLNAVSAASQVKWNKVAFHLLATAHDSDLRLWDVRKSNVPVQYITAHLSKIHGLDWNPCQEYQLASASQDATVKFWDVTNPRKAENILSANYPIWRARYTPFGEGFITVIVPQLRRGENSLLLWNISHLSSPVHTFVGHTDMVLEFHWRKQREGGKDFHLVTWSRDHTLRIWRIEPHLQKLCGHDIYDDLEEPDFILNTDIPEVTDTASLTSQTSNKETEGSRTTPPLSPKRTVQDVHSPSQPKTLLQEFSLVNIDIPNLTIDDMDAINRTCTISAISGKNIIKLLMTFPNLYPNNAAPSFQFVKGTSVDQIVKSRLLKVLRETSLQHIKRNRSCLEPCLRQLIATLDAVSVREDDVNIMESTYVQPNIVPISLTDATLPFPKTCGARFGGAGYLVCFSQPYNIRSYSIDSTPRVLYGINNYSSSFQQIPSRSSQTSSQFSYYPTVARSPSSEKILNTHSYFKKSRTRSKTRQSEMKHGENKKRSKAGLVFIHDISALLPIHQTLAHTYTLDHNDVPNMCQKNAMAAAAVGRKDLVQIWSLASIATSQVLVPDLDPDSGPPWAHHPFGRKLLQALVEHCSKIRDIQTLAMLCCAFGGRAENQASSKRASKCISDAGSHSPFPGKTLLGTKGASSRIQTKFMYVVSRIHRKVSESGGSPYHTIHPSDTSLEGWNLGTLKTRRSNSWSDSFEDFGAKSNLYVIDPKEVERGKHETNTKLLDSKLISQYDEFKKVYAEILYQWQCLKARTEVLKYVSSSSDQHNGIEFVTKCHYCFGEAQCNYCKNFAFQCAICHITVKGSSSFCLICGHGGHTKHMLEWFTEEEVCPTGCGCSCLKNSFYQES